MKKKNSNLLTLATLAVVALIIFVSLIPLAPGLVMKSGENIQSITGYWFTFGNSAFHVSKEPNGGMIAAFSLTIIGGVFALLALIFVIAEGTKKFGAFLLFIAGGCLLATGIIYLLAKNMPAVVEEPGNWEIKLGFGFIGGGAGGIVAGALGLVGGFLGLAAKNK